MPSKRILIIQASEVKKFMKLDDLKQMKCDMAGKGKLEDLMNSDMREAQDYVSWTVEECRMAYRLQTKMFDCRTNMPSRYGRDLQCRACRPDPASGQTGLEESQDHLEVCEGYREQWKGLGPMTPLTRVRYFIRVKTSEQKP